MPICGEQTGRPGFMQPQDKAKKKPKSNIDLISCIRFSFLLPEHESCIKGEADERLEELIESNLDLVF